MFSVVRSFVVSHTAVTPFLLALHIWFQRVGCRVYSAIDMREEEEDKGASPKRD